MLKKTQALLMLDDGTCFEGIARGACQEASGEVVFTTGMVGYQETLTDPSFSGQIVVFTSAHIGNYGVAAQDDESARLRSAGAVFHDLFTVEAGTFPHWRAEQSLEDRLKKEGITSISNVDTRSLTLHLREHGARNGIISAVDFDKPSLLRRAKDLPKMQGLDLASKVSCSEKYLPHNLHRHVPGVPVTTDNKDGQADNRTLDVAVLDFGVKSSILRQMQARGMRLTVWPATTQAADILATKPDGIFLSNGPGDPEPCTYAIKMIKDVLGKVPVFGICLGHQLLGLALGAKTYKLPFGHHGLNHPVKDMADGRVLITSQNHGFCVDADSLPKSASPSHWNLNDNTLEGITCMDVPAFSVQFHPEAGPGPNDATGLFDRFRTLML